MKGIVLKHRNPSPVLAVETTQIPPLQKSQVLVRIELAAVTNHDLAFVKGWRWGESSLPVIPGFEGCGVVVDCGDQLHRWRFQGKRVCVLSLTPGTWSEYVIVPTETCFLLNDSLTFDQAVGLFLPALTICMCTEIIETGNMKAIIQTGGTGDICKGMLRACNYRRVDCVSVVSDMREADDLNEIGVKYLVLDSDPRFQEKIASVVGELSAKCAFDTVGGVTAGAILNGLGEGGVMYSYPTSYQAPAISGIQPGSLIFQKKKLLGLDVFSWFSKKSSIQKLGLINHIQRYHFMYRPEVFAKVQIEDIWNALRIVEDQFGQGIVVLRIEPSALSLPEISQPLIEESKREEEKDRLLMNGKPRFEQQTNLPSIPDPEEPAIELSTISPKSSPKDLSPPI